MEKNKGNENIEISEFQDLRGVDLSNEDLRFVPVDILEKINFDTKTKWPDKKKLPEGFDPERLMEESKNPGLGIRELHKKGIDGSGVKVAILDQKLLLGHEEYKGKLIDYSEYGDAGNSASMHGAAVASLLVGRNCGVAPGAQLVFRGTKGRDYKNRSKALLDIIEANKKLSNGEKIKIVSVSMGYNENNPEPGLDEWISSINESGKEGIIFVDVRDRHGLEFSGGGSVNDKENIEDYNPWLEYNKIDKIIIPNDYRTVASWRGNNEYTYYGKGGLSWAVPYLAGLFALALQTNPNVSGEAIAEAINKTALVNKRGLKVVNPKGMVESMRK